MKTADKKYRVIFMGTPEFAVPSLQALLENPQLDIAAVITQPDKPVGRNGMPQPSPIKQLALAQGLVVWTPAKLKNNMDIIAQIKTTNPDVIIVAAYGKILPQEILDIPKESIVNVHGSYLPKYRGASPIAAAILNGDTTTGITLMKMVLEVDAGPIIAISKPVPIEATQTQLSLSHLLAKVGADLLEKNLIPYLEGRIMLTPQDESRATYTHLIEKEDGLINWQEAAEITERKIRAYCPKPGAYTFWQGKRLKIAFGRVIPTQGSFKTGEVWLTPDNHIAVTTSEDSLQLEIICLEGKSLTGDRDFLRGHPTIVGAVLG